jgi:nicotinate-nucleotide adenylyltransferase
LILLRNIKVNFAMSNLKQPVGILGGTFDPIHLGHLKIARSVAQAFNLVEVRLMPCYQPAHRALPIATPEQRLAMVRCAIQHEPLLEVEDSEIQRQGVSYMADTLEILHQQLPHTPICLILGLDAFVGFPTWHRYSKILELAHLIVIPRPDYSLPQTGIIAELLRKHVAKDKTALHRTIAGHIILHHLPFIDISATAIRQQIATGDSPIAFLPPPAYEYIVKNNIYLKRRAK